MENRFAAARRRYLREHRDGIYTGMLLTGKLDDHLKETKGHIKTLEAVFKSIGKEAKGEKCDAMDGLLKEADGLIEAASGHALDVALIGAAQAVEHYEIARYGTMCRWAEMLGQKQASKLLRETLAEEEATDKTLTEIAETSVNQAALKAA